MGAVPRGMNHNGELVARLNAAGPPTLTVQCLGIVHLDTPFLRRSGTLNEYLEEAVRVGPLKIAYIAPERQLFSRVEHCIAVMCAEWRGKRAARTSQQGDDPARRKSTTRP